MSSAADDGRPRAVNNRRNPRRLARTRPTGRPTWSWWPSATPRWGAQPPGPVRVTARSRPATRGSARHRSDGRRAVQVERCHDPASTSIGRCVAEPDRDRGRVAGRGRWALPGQAGRGRTRHGRRDRVRRRPRPGARGGVAPSSAGCGQRHQGLARRPHDQRERRARSAGRPRSRPVAVGRHRFEVQAWIDPFATWRDATRRKLDAGVDTPGDLLAGAQLLEQLAEVAAKRDAKALRSAADALTAGDPLRSRTSTSAPSSRRWPSRRCAARRAPPARPSPSSWSPSGRCSRPGTSGSPGRRSTATRRRPSGTAPSAT